MRTDWLRYITHRYCGRLHVDEELMTELQLIKRETVPSEILFIADAMTGQDAVRSAQEFHEQVGLTGVILTKMEGDTRGGAALSIKEVTGQPIKFLGVGERYDAIEPFYPDRIAQRILGWAMYFRSLKRFSLRSIKKRRWSYSRSSRVTSSLLKIFAISSVR
jgi:signal recognition particle subunit SRP54